MGSLMLACKSSRSDNTVAMSNNKCPPMPLRSLKSDCPPGTSLSAVTVGAHGLGGWPCDVLQRISNGEQSLKITRDIVKQNRLEDGNAISTTDISRAKPERVFPQWESNANAMPSPQPASSIRRPVDGLRRWSVSGSPPT